MKIQYYISFIILLFFSLEIEVQAQDLYDAKNIWREATGKNFYEVQAQMEEYYRTHPTGKGSGYKQYKRWENLMKDRINLDGTVPNLAAKYMKAYANQRENLSSNKSLLGNWKNLGPSSYVAGPQAYAPGLGRINCIAFHPSDANTIYIGAPAGGLWKTTDGGVNWKPLAQDLAQIGVSAIVVKPSAPNEVYILTGDGDGGQTLSIGVYKSTDGGQTFTNTALPWPVNTNVRGYAMKMAPINNNIITIATDAGLYQTGNSGTSWNLIRSGNFRDFEYKTNNENIYFASTDNDVLTYNGGWTTIHSNIPNVNRIALAVTPDEPNAVYQVRGPGYNAGTGSNPNYKFRGLYKSTNSGVSYTQMSDSPNIFGGHIAGQDSTSQSAYDMAIIANPNDGSEVLVGGVNLWGSTNNGTSWSNKAHWSLGTPPNFSNPYVHADIHALEYNPVDGKLYCGSDGGIFVSSDFGDTWTDLSATLSVSMFYRIDGVENDPNKLILGSQDNGTFIWDGDVNEKGEMRSILGADGMDCKISPTNTDSVYYSWQNGGLFRSGNNGDTRTWIRPGASNGAWTTPFELDPNNSGKIVTAYRDTVYVSTNRGSSWSASMPGGTNTGLFRFIYINPSNSEIYAATNNAIFHSPANVTPTSWTNVTYNLPTVLSGVNITSFTIREGNNRIYLTLSGTSSTNKVFWKEQTGTVWNNVTNSGLPNVSINCIDYTSSQFFVGTDIGLYRRTDGSSTWESFNNGMPNLSTPNVKVMDIEVNESDGLIYAATFGRGLWVSGFYGTCVKTEFLTQGNDTNEGNPGTEYIKAGEYIEASRVIEGTSSNSVIYQAGERQRLLPGFHVKQNAFFKATLNPCSFDDPDS